jgi:prepilin signal peptidase PulO-like enzyme (type II secretory pathway)
MKRIYYWMIGIMIMFTPLGMLSEGTAWGEWGTDELTGTLGYVPQGIEQAEAGWKAFLPDYSVPMLGEIANAEVFGYILSALVGTALIYTIMLVFGKVLASNNKQRYSMRQGR